MPVVVGTKADLVKERGRQVGMSDAKSFTSVQHDRHLQRALANNPNSFLAKINPKQSYFETSAKTGDGVNELFQYLQNILIAQLQKTGGGASTSTGKERAGSRSGRPTEKVIKLDEPPPPGQRPSDNAPCCKSQLIYNFIDVYDFMLTFGACVFRIFLSEIIIFYTDVM